MPPRRALRIHVLALPECAPIVPVGMIDLFRKSSELAYQIPSQRRQPRVELTLVSGANKKVVKAAGGLVLQCDATMETARKGDLVVVPALDPDIATHLVRHRAVIRWLKRAYARGADLASACTGSFLLAEAGLLEGRAATTHWAFQPMFAQRYPNVRLQPQAILVDQGRLVTAGGATSFIQLALFLVERTFGHDVAWAASRMFLIDPNKSPQGAYAAFSGQKNHSDDAVLRAQDIMEREFGRLCNLDALARRVSLSRRTFARRFGAATGNTPREYVQRVRVEEAKRVLSNGASVASAARHVGYDDVVAFRKIFVRLSGLTPADYRLRYGPDK